MGKSTKKGKKKQEWGGGGGGAEWKGRREKTAGVDGKGGGWGGGEGKVRKEETGEGEDGRRMERKGRREKMRR